MNLIDKKCTVKRTLLKKKCMLDIKRAVLSERKRREENVVET